MWLPLLLLACAGTADPPTDGVAERVAEVALPGDWRGVSGLERTATGWVGVQERVRYLLVAEGDQAPVARFVHDVPAGLDTESIAVLDGALWVGTEGTGLRDADLLLRLAPDGADLRVAEQRPLSYAPFGLQGEHNRGVEALANCGDSLLAGAEVAAERGGRRLAPAWLLPPTGRVRPLWLGLTTATGKLAALTCQRDGGDIVAWGIERHYTVRRVLRWRIPPGQDLAELAPEASWDLDPALPGAPNPEGLALLAAEPDGAVTQLLATDNDNGPVVGPTRLYRLRLAPPPGAH